MAAADLALVTLIFVAGLRGSNGGVPDFYPDLIREEARSCWERTLFSEKKDPLYDWAMRSLAFQRHKDIRTQELTKAYRKLSTWRVADNTMAVYNSPEPHVLGGLFIQNPRHWLLKMVVNWGLSIRACLFEEEEGMCLYTAQVVVAEDGSFRLLLAEVPYRSSRDSSNTTYLTNWVSNARTAGAVGIRRLKGKDYFHPEFRRLCDRKRLIAYTPDVIAYLGSQLQECYCVGEVCIVGRQVSKVEFSKGHCKDANSYWRILPSGGLNLHSYSPKLGHFFVLNATFPNSPPLQNLSIPVKEMGKLSACFERWLDTQAIIPILGRNTTQAVLKACDSELRPDVIAVHPTSQVWIPLSSVSRDIQKLVTSGDNCLVEKVNYDDAKCCSDTILTQEQLDELRGITRNFMDAKDVRLHTSKEWQSTEFRLNNILWEYAGAMLAVCTACLLTSKLELDWNLLGQIENGTALIILAPFKSTKRSTLISILLVLIIIPMSWHLVAQPRVMTHWDFLDDQVSRQQPQQQFTEMVAAAAYVLYATAYIFFYSFKLRKASLGRLIFSTIYILSSMAVGRQLWLNLKSLESTPQAGWVHTYQVQPQRKISFLVTTTSTITVEPYWIWCSLLHIATTTGCMCVVDKLPKLVHRRTNHMICYSQAMVSTRYGVYRIWYMATTIGCEFVVDKLSKLLDMRNKDYSLAHVLEYYWQQLSPMFIRYLHTLLPIKKHRLIASISTGGHHGRIEMGQWAREACEDRICQCYHQGAIEDERHALQASCPIYEQNGARYPQLVVRNQQLHQLPSADSVGSLSSQLQEVMDARAGVPICAITEF